MLEAMERGAAKQHHALMNAYRVSVGKPPLAEPASSTSIAGEETPERNAPPAPRRQREVDQPAMTRALRVCLTSRDFADVQRAVADENAARAERGDSTQSLSDLLRQRVLVPPGEYIYSSVDAEEWDAVVEAEKRRVRARDAQAARERRLIALGGSSLALPEGEKRQGRYRTSPEQPRQRTVGAHLTDEEYATLTETAASLRLTMSDFVLSLVQGTPLDALRRHRSLRSNLNTRQACDAFRREHTTAGTVPDTERDAS